MIKLLLELMQEWWGVLIVVAVALAIWVALSVCFYRQFFKRFYDVVLSALAIIVLSPVLIILTVVGAIKMKGNPFFTQLRPGKRSKKTGETKIFKLIKFRTMTNAKDANGNLLPDKERLTRYGKILRSTSLDELPELFNIFLGHMSIVGPRPLLVKYLPYYTQEEARRHDVRPGLTGLAQVNGRNAISWDDKLAYDIKYVDGLSAMMDLKVLFLTVYKVVKRQGIQFDNSKPRLGFIAERELRMKQEQQDNASVEKDA